MIRTRPKPLDDGLPFSKMRSRPAVCDEPEAPRAVPGKVSSRIRSPRHLAYVRQQRCCRCGAFPSQAHHLTIGPEPKARGLKASDTWAVPLCQAHHDPNSRVSVHFWGDERAWWQAAGIDPLPIAERLTAASVAAGRVKLQSDRDAA